MDMSNASGAPMTVALLVIAAIVILGGVGLTFSGSVHF